MRRLILAAVAASAVLATAVPASAHPTIPLSPTVPTDLTHAATDNIEYLGRFPEHAGTAGGQLLGDRYYLTDPRGVFIYDASTPESPELLGFTPVLQETTGVALAQEDPDTDGNILLVDGRVPGGASGMHVIDVSDPTDPRPISSIGTTDHTWECISGEVGGEMVGCAYAYGRTGHIIDLTDPTSPTRLPVTWRQHVSYGSSSNSPYAHDITEIRPGLAAVAGASLLLLDTTDPKAPVLLNRVNFGSRWSSLGYHSVEWANDGRDPILVAGTELSPTGANAGTDCEEGATQAAVIDTWDMRAFLAAYDAWKAGEEGVTVDTVREAKLTKLDSFDAGSRGIFLDGQYTGHVLYCAHWMELHPEFDGGGKMVVGYYNRGTRFVDIGPDGKMTEIAWVVGADGYTGSSQWVSDDVVYIHDYTRGVEVVKLKDQAATGTYESKGDAIAATSAITLAAGEGGFSSANAVPATFGLLLLAFELWRRRRHAVDAPLA